MMIPYKEYKIILAYYVELVTKLFVDEITKLMDTNKNLEFLPLNENILKRNINRLDTSLEQPGFYNFLRCGDKKLSISQFMRDFILPSLLNIFSQSVDPRWVQLSEIIEKSPYDFM